MKRLILILTLVLAAQTSQAVELVEGQVVANPVEMERLQVCEEQGGCHIVTVAQMKAIIRTVVLQLLRDNSLSCTKEL